MGVRKHKIAVTIICFNEEDRIKACLDSVVGWADQVIIFDSGSTDRTVEIAMQYNAEIYQSDWPGYGPQRMRTLQRVRCEWVFAIDADERASDALKDEIDQIFSQEYIPCAVYRIPWIPFFLGKQLHHGRYASPQARLFKREGAQYPSAQIHETLIFPPGDVGFLKGGLVHHSFRDYSHCVQKHADYAWLLAKEKYGRKKVTSLFFATARSWWEFIHQYFFRKLFLDGAHGYLQAIVLKQYTFHKYAGLWSLAQTNAEFDDAFSPEHRQRRQSEINMDNSSITRLK